VIEIRVWHGYYRQRGIKMLWWGREATIRVRLEGEAYCICYQ